MALEHNVVFIAQCHDCGREKVGNGQEASDWANAHVVCYSHHHVEVREASWYFVAEEK